MTQPIPETSDTKAQKPSLSSVIGQLSAALGRLSTGDLASLRRMKAGDLPPSSFWSLIPIVMDCDGIRTSSGADRDSQEKRWAEIIAGMARNKGFHSPGVPTGKVLAEVISEPRFLKLIHARGDSLLEALRVTSLVLANKARTIDWTQLAALLLTEGNNGEEQSKRRLARDFYSKIQQQS
jgi:CRISPR type I-E-associated protein CasB/Cse2